MANFLEGYRGNTAIVGTMWGDEGKGKATDLLAPMHDMGGKGQGSNNAGHTFIKNGIEINVHQIPSVINEPGKLNILGPGMYVNLVALMTEVAELRAAGIEVNPDNLAISDRAQLTQPSHVALDELRESGDSSQGSTKSGVAFVAADKYVREGIRGEALISMRSVDIERLAYESLREWTIVKDKDGEVSAIRPLADKQTAQEKAKEFAIAVETFKPYITDTIPLLHGRLSQGQTILLEGNQAAGLGINFGKYPFVTSSDTTVTGILSGMGMNRKQLDLAIGAAKALPSKVGKGPFITRERASEKEAILRGKRGAVDGEYGKRTKRPREVGYFDAVQVAFANRLNGFDALMIGKIDCWALCKEGIKVATAYELDDREIHDVPANVNDLARCNPLYEVFPPIKSNEVRGVTDFDKLPKPVKNAVTLIEKVVGVGVIMLGTGPTREETIIR